MSAVPVATCCATAMTFDRSYSEVAQSLGLSRQAVEQIERRALIKCRKWCETHGYELSDLVPDGEIGTYFPVQSDGETD